MKMKLAFAIATVTALQQADVTRADCEFGSNYTRSWNSSTYCSSFDVAYGEIILSSASSTTSSDGDTNTTTNNELANLAIWKVGDKDSTVHCYSNVTVETVSTHYPNGSKFVDATGDFHLALDNSNDTVDEGLPLSIPGFYFFNDGRAAAWVKDGNWDHITKAEGDITDLCAVLGGGGGDAAPAPTPPTTEAPSSGHMAAVTIIPCAAAASILNYFFS